MSLNQIHGTVVLVWTPVVGNLVLAVWAWVSGLRGRRTLSSAFWTVVLLVLAVLVVQAAAGLLLLLGGTPLRRGIHLLYAVLVVVAGGVQYGLRPGGFLRRSLSPAPQAFNEPRVLALLCLTQAALMMRAWMTGLGSP